MADPRRLCAVSRYRGVSGLEKGSSAKMKYTMHKWTELGPLMIAYSTGGRMVDDVFEKFVHDLKTRPIRAYLGANVGNFEITSIQRKYIAQELKGKNLVLAIVTDELLVRGIVTAVSWLGMNVRSFSWAEMRSALRYLALPPHLDDKALEIIQQLKKSCEEELRRGPKE